MARITVEQIRTLRACVVQVQLFIDTFGPGADVTLDNCLLAAKVGLDITWAANNLLPGKCSKDYEAQEWLLWNAYKAQEQLLWDAYEAQRRPLRDAYEAQKQSLWNTYAAQIQPL